MGYNIDIIVQKIRTALYGRDVRGSIADGVEQIGRNQENLETTFNQLVINSGQSNAEIVAARGPYSQLKNRLDSMATGSPRGAYATLAELQQAYPAGTTGIFVVQATGNWYWWNGSAWVAGGPFQATQLSDGSVTSSKLANGAVLYSRLRTSWADIKYNNSITYNQQTHKITTTSSIVVGVEAGSFTTGLRSQEIDTTSVDASPNLKYCYTIPSENWTLRFDNYEDIPSTVNILVLFSYFAGTITSMSPNAIRYINSSGNNVAIIPPVSGTISSSAMTHSWGWIVERGTIIVNEQDLTVTVSENTYYMNDGSTRYLYPTTFSITAPGSIKYGYIDRNGDVGVLKVETLSTITAQSIIILFTVFDGVLTTISEMDAIKYINMVGVEVTSIADNGLTSRQVTFQQIDLSNTVWAPNYFIGWETGTRFSYSYSSLMHSSDYIDFPYAGLTCKLRTRTDADLSGIAFFTENNSYITGMRTGINKSLINETTFIVPPRTAKIRFTCYDADPASVVGIGIESNSSNVADIRSEKTFTTLIKTQENVNFDQTQGYFFKNGDSTDVPEIFKTAQLYGVPDRGSAILENDTIKISSVTSTSGNSIGVRFILDNLTPETIRYTPFIQLEFDVDIQDPISLPTSLSCQLSIWAIGKSAASGNYVPALSSIQVPIKRQAHQHVSYRLLLTEAAMDAITARSNIRCFGIYIINWPLFTNNLITLSNIYFKRTEIRQELIGEKLINYDNSGTYFYEIGTEDDIPSLFNRIEYFSSANIDATLTSSNTVEITEQRATSGNTSGIRFVLPDLKPALFKYARSIVLEMDVEIENPESFPSDSSWLIGIWPLQSSLANWATSLVTASVTIRNVARQHVSQELKLDQAGLDQLTNAGINLESIRCFGLYVIRLPAFSNNKVTLSKMFLRRGRVGGLSSTDDMVLVPNEMPLDVLKRDGGLFTIFRKVAYIGDSLSSGFMDYYDSAGVWHGVNLWEFSYGQFIARMTGTDFFNSSTGGLTVRTWLSGYASALFDNPDNLCKAYIIYLGTNDQSKILSGEMPLGSLGDIDLGNWQNNVDSFAGRYGEIIQRIKQTQPKAKIFCVTVPKRPTSATDNVCNPIIRQIPSLFTNVYLIDLWRYAKPIPHYTGSHLNAIGYQIFGWQITSYIDYIIRKNPVEFNEVQFIGTNYQYNR